MVVASAVSQKEDERIKIVQLEVRERGFRNVTEILQFSARGLGGWWGRESGRSRCAEGHGR
jgi:hypothetical protein